ncbi:T9SS type A sorting domain-containing protein [Adhaeribacter sp. BT258]|uniref:T9SS type A sorting domain-containing protein n=1 Tax=Adhaeribacter terrigena TaxID=2793070 RepID=A0ABS1C886_9BACT|nr:T9SS type A sorting domain-containing protein [Adhaeribacter terrigena]MBK0404883.1 T9SS type A sorting domain-containing protein [Adhaeribacter terrigena]
MRKYCLLLLLLLSARFAQSQAPACSTPITTFPYVEHFASGPGGWTSGGPNSSWALGYPTGKLYMNYTASDSNSWITSLTGPNNASENSYVVSPCFNLTGLTAPVIEMKIWWNSENNGDGAVLQSSIDGGLTWQRVGDYGDPYNWYNSNNIASVPGSQPPVFNNQGWTGRVGSSPGNGSGGWVRAKHKLNGLGGQASVRLRIAFASDLYYEDDGFGFDDVQIYETPNHDAGILSITSPVSKCGSTNQESVSVMIKNFGLLAQNAIPVTYRLGNNPPVTEVITSNMLSEDVLVYTFNAKVNLATPGTYPLVVYTGLPSDGDHGNDTINTLVHAIPTIAAYPYFQNFENGNGGWLTSGVNSSWALGTPAKSTINSAASGANAWVTGLTGNYNSGENSQVLGPCFNMSSLTSPLLTMKVWWNAVDGAAGAVLQSSIDNGITWQTVGAFRDPDNWYNHNSISSNPGGQQSGWSGSNMNFINTGSNGWVTVKHLLTGLGGQSNVKLRIAFASDNNFLTDDGFAFDNIAIYENPANDVGITALVAPVSGNCGASAQENVTVTIKNFGSATQTNIPVSYQIGSKAAITGVFTGSLASGVSVNYTFPTPANLNSSGNFEFLVSTALPGDTFLTNNSLADTVFIFNPISGFPYVEDFETYPVGVPGTIPPGWTLTTGTALFYPYSWEVANGPTPWQGSGPVADHTLGNASGKYMYAPVGSAAGDSTELITPCIDLTGLTSPGFSFWYHMAGADINKFQVEVSTNNGATWANLFTLTGPQQMLETDAWRKKIISLQGYSGNIKLKFKAKAGNGPAGEIALDDLKFFNLAATDLEVLALQLPAPGCSLSPASDVCMTLMNVGTSAQSNFPVTYQVNGAPVVTEMFTGTIPAGGVAQFCFSTKANFSLAGQHNVSVAANAAGDGDTINNVMQDSTFNQQVIATLPYFQNFDAGNGGWVAGGSNSSWALGTPAKTVINSAASGTNSWVTNLTGEYNASEDSYVMSPCFNFSALTGDPDIEMKVWWNAQTNIDGAVLQTSTDGGLTWKNVGEMGDALNWYNDSSIYAQPGGQTNYMARGWTGTIADKGSNGWVTVKHKLDNLAGEPSVKIRIAFGANSWGQDDGFAFDDVRIVDNTNNLAVNKFIPLANHCNYGPNEKVEVELENLGSTPIANVSMQFQVNGGNPVSAMFAGPIAGGAKTNFTFPAGANLTTVGNHQIRVIAGATNDPDHTNDTLVHYQNNALYASLPFMLDFETAASSLNGMQLRTHALSAITDGAGASFGAGSKGMIMEGFADSSWTIPGGTIDPWLENPENFAGAYFCFTPTGFLPTDSLWLEFELKQLFKIANVNTNFRVTVNGNQVGATYRPPFGGGPAIWQHVKILLTAFISQGTMQIGLESSVKESYANGNGTANLIDNVRVSGNPTNGTKENILQDLVVVYPNPSSGIFNLRLPASTQKYTLEITDLAGKIIREQIVAGGNVQLELTDLARGIYILKINGAAGSATRKLIMH